MNTTHLCASSSLGSFITSNASINHDDASSCTCNRKDQAGCDMPTIEVTPLGSQPSSPACPLRYRRSASLIQIAPEESNQAESSDSEDSLSTAAPAPPALVEQSPAQQQSMCRSYSESNFSPAEAISTTASESSGTMLSRSSSSSSSLTKDITVLHPFNHQVGGHTQIMLLNQSTLCKPLVQRELLFYLNIPRDLIGFVPNYKGVVEIRHNENHNPILYHPIKQHSSNTGSPSSSYVRAKPELRVQLCTCNDRRLLQKQFSIQSNNPPPSSTGSTNSSPGSFHYSTRPSQRYFMLLENIASYHHLPCVLDLKMGTRQHGEDASDEKRRRQMAKCAATTSATLGVRICGMQVYHKTSNNAYRMYSVDKYYGRKIQNELALKAELEIFLKNRFFQIGPIIKKLKELRKRVIEVQRTRPIRFYSTSLLIVAEGCAASLHSRHAAPKKSNSDGEEDEDELDYDEEDDFDCFEDDDDDEVDGDVLRRSVSVDFDIEDVDALSDAQDATSTMINKKSDLAFMSDESSNDSLLDIPKLSRLQVSSPPSSSSPSPASLESRYLSKVFTCNRDHRHRPCSESNSGTDVRMIDFAHTSLSANSSPDGFLFGLENLIRLLNDIREGGTRRLTTTTAHSASLKRLRGSSDNQTTHHLHHHHGLAQLEQDSPIVTLH